LPLPADRIREQGVAQRLGTWHGRELRVWVRPAGSRVMGLVLRAVGGCVAVACALSLSGAALQPEPVRAGTVGSAVASVTTPGLQDGQDVPPVEVEVTGPAAADATVEDLSGPD